MLSKYCATLPCNIVYIALLYFSAQGLFYAAFLWGCTKNTPTLVIYLKTYTKPLLHRRSLRVTVSCFRLSPPNSAKKIAPFPQNYLHKWCSLYLIFPIYDTFSACAVRFASLFSGTLPPWICFPPIPAGQP